MKECIKPCQRLLSTESRDGCRRRYGIILWWIYTLCISCPPAGDGAHNSSGLRLNKLDYSSRGALFIFPSSFSAGSWLVFQQLHLWSIIWHLPILQLMEQVVKCCPPDFKVQFSVTNLSPPTWKALKQAKIKNCLCTHASESYIYSFDLHSTIPNLVH